MRRLNQKINDTDETSHLSKTQPPVYSVCLVFLHWMKWINKVSLKPDGSNAIGNDYLANMQ